jgi:hypothetical protein
MDPQNWSIVATTTTTATGRKDSPNMYMSFIVK